MSLKNAAPCLAAVQNSWDQEHMIQSAAALEPFSTIDLNDLQDFTNEMNLPVELMDTSDPTVAFNDEGDLKEWITPADDKTSGQIFQVKPESDLQTPTVEFSSPTDFSELFNIANQDEEVIADFVVPVVEREANLDATWDLQSPPTGVLFSANPLAACNPLEAEGRELPKMPKKPRKPLFLDIGAANAVPVKMEETTVPDPLANLDTPAVANFLDQNKDEFDLLDFIADTDRPVNDPAFKSLLENTGPKMPNVEVEVPGTGKKFEIKPLEAVFEEQPAKRGRGRPRLPRTTEIAGARYVLNQRELFSQSFNEQILIFPLSSRPRGRPPGSGKRQLLDHSYGGASSSNLSDDDVKDIKYRRMRDLNNAASKRCRQKRRQKFDSLEQEEQILRVKNQNLKMKYRKMKELVDELKKRFLNQVANPKPAPKPAPTVIDLGEILRQENIQL